MGRGGAERPRSPLEGRTVEDWLKMHTKLGEALCTCAEKHLVNFPLPGQESTRAFSLLQHCYWHYVDEIHSMNKRDFPSVREATFYVLLHSVVDVIGRYCNCDELLDGWKRYLRAPRSVAILLDSSLERCLLVQSWRRDTWTHPSGKCDADESNLGCAIREVLEETGVDISSCINEADQFQVLFQEKDTLVRVTLFVVCVSTLPDKLGATSQHEVAKMAWFPLDILPGWSSVVRKTKRKFANVVEFTPQLKAWVERGGTAIVAADQSESISPTNVRIGEDLPDMDGTSISHEHDSSSEDEVLFGRA